MTRPARPAFRWSRFSETGVLHFVGAALAMTMFHLVGASYLSGFRLDLGSLNFPTPRYLTLVAFWTPIGALSAGLLAVALARALTTSPRCRSLVDEWNRLTDRRFLLWATVAGFVIPVTIRFGLLKGAPLTDDESAYRFAAELLATGRLWTQSPELKLFFDQNFMINDGRLYPVYFLGWPALLAPCVWIGATGIANPLLSALTVFPLLRSLTALVGSAWARAGVLLFLSSPFLQIGAATGLSHTSCIAALVWCFWLYLRATTENASRRDHFGFALAFAMAFCIRPQSALPIGAPLVLSWMFAVARMDARVRWKAVSAFLIPTIGLATLFLAVLWAQNGSPWTIGYSRYAQYLVENEFRFTTFRALDLTRMPGFDFSRIGEATARAASGMFRLNADLFGWPSSFLFLAMVPLAAPGRARMLWAMFGCYALFLLFQRDWGIDTYGPVHAVEAAVPVVFLTMVGARNFEDWLRSTGPEDWYRRAFAPSLLVALIVTAWAGFIPVRLEAVRQIAANVNIPLQAPERAGVQRGIVFAPYPFVRRCVGEPANFVFFHPTNDPDLSNDLLWVNDIGPAENQALVERLGDRSGYRLEWTTNCNVSLTPLGGPPVRSSR